MSFLPKPEYLPSITSLSLDSDNEELPEQDITEEHSNLPKDVDFVDLTGRLTFDPEANPSAETRENTLYNSLLYTLDDVVPQCTEPTKTHTKRLTLNTCTENSDVRHYSLSFIQQSKTWIYSTQTRTLLVAWRGCENSNRALSWTLQEFAHNSDEIIIVRVVSLPTIISKGSKSLYDESLQDFKKLKKLNTKHLSLRILFEVKIGGTIACINNAIAEYSPSINIFGTKGLKKPKLKNILSEDDSVAKHFMEEGIKPSILVSPNYVNTEHAPLKNIEESTFKQQILDYPSRYNQATCAKAIDMEKSDSSESTPRTSRFLRVGKSMARSVSSSVNDLSPVTSRDRNLSPARTLSPMRFFKRKD
ncbi:hypothetical protein DAMA08_031950 [Martiniozyma asiatica (nom. inval.)]|nr:hypothetical protein DAMA08_031950 [Martiniozyma asiatica]